MNDIQDSMKLDKQIFLDYAKEKIIDGNKMYRDLYISDTWAFLAPDNYGAETTDDIELDIETQIQQAGKSFDKVCNEIRKHFSWACKETDDVYNTRNWRVRDFISEAEYKASQINREQNHRAFAMWKRVVNIGNQILVDDMLCVKEHMSKYDKLN